MWNEKALWRGNIRNLWKGFEGGGVQEGMIESKSVMASRVLSDASWARNDLIGLLVAVMHRAGSKQRRWTD